MNNCTQKINADAKNNIYLKLIFALNDMKLKDFVTIHEVKSTDTISRLNGKPAISLSVTAAQTANTLNVVNDVKDTIKTFEKKYSHNVHVKITLDMINEESRLPIPTRLADLETHKMRAVLSGNHSFAQ